MGVVGVGWQNVHEGPLGKRESAKYFSLINNFPAGEFAEANGNEC